MNIKQNDTAGKTAGTMTNNTASQLMPMLKKDILSGAFVAGEKLVMAKLKKRYDVGTGPLREALSQLITEQLVIAEDQRGFYVHPLSQEEMLDLYQTRSHIEALCIVEAIKKGDVDWEADVLAAMHRMKKAKYLLDQDFEGLLQWELKHQAFHSAIAKGCGSATLLHIRQSLYEKTARYRLLWLKNNMVSDDYFEQNHREHEQLLQCVLAHDAPQAEQVMKDHLKAPGKALQGVF